MTEFSPFIFFAVFVVNKLGPSKNRIKTLLLRGDYLGLAKRDAMDFGIELDLASIY